MLVLAFCLHKLFGSGPPVPPKGDSVLINSYEYWFDRDFDSRVIRNIPASAAFSLTSAVDITCSDGVHTLNFRVKDTKEQWSVVQTQAFYKYPAQGGGGQVSLINYFEYWFDKDFDGRKKLPATASARFSLSSVDASSCSDGIHTLNFRVSDDGGRWSAVQTQSFYKYSSQGGNEGRVSHIHYYEYWFDQDFAGRKTYNITPDQYFSLASVDASACSEGVHMLNFRVKDDAGRWSAVQSQSFYKYSSHEGNEGRVSPINHYEYWFDQGFEHRISRNVSANTAFSLSMVAADTCSEGVHTLNLRVRDESGRWSAVQTQSFYRLPSKQEGGGASNLITAYRYWFDHNFDNMVTVELPQPTPSYEVVSVVVPPDIADDYEHHLRMQFLDNTGQWSVVESKQVTMGLPQPLQQVDFEALAAFYDAMGGAQWTSTLKNYYKPWETNNTQSPVYTWYGISTYAGHVSALTLPNNNLTGTLPDMGAFTGLSALKLSGNRIRALALALPAHITTLELGGQIIEMGDLALPPSANLSLEIPNICLYSHSARDFSATPRFEVFIDDQSVDTVTVSGGRAVIDKAKLSSAAGNSSITLLQITGDAKDTQLSWRGTDASLKQLTLTGIVVNDKVYDGSTEAQIVKSGKLMGLAYGHDVTVNYSGVIATFDNARTGTDKAVTVTGISLSGQHTALYTLAQPKGLTAAITPKILTVSGITVKNKTYDGTIAAVIDQVGRLEGVVTGNNVSIDISKATAVYNDAKAGAGKQATVTGLILGGADAANYTLKAQGATGSITKAELTLTGLTIRDKVYDGATTAYVGQAGILNGTVPSDKVSTGPVTAAYNTPGVGEAKAVNVTYVSLTGNDAANYTLKEWPASHTAAITPKEVTVYEMTVADKVYDGTTTATINSAGTLSWKAVGDDVTVDVSHAGARFTDANAGYGKPVTITGVELTGTAVGNYRLKQPIGITGIIARAPVTILTVPVASSITEGQMLRRSELAGGTASVPGRFKFELPDLQPSVGTLAHTAWFIPDDGNYESVLFNVQVNVIPKPYTIFARADKDIYTSGETVAITGKVTASGVQTVTNITVNVNIDMAGYRRTLQAKTNTSGEFSATFVPQNDEAGHYSMVCNVSNEPNDEVNHEFDIIGIRLATTGYITWEMEQNKNKTGSIRIQNRTSKPLTNVTVEVLSGTPNAQVTFMPVAKLSGNSYVDVNYTVTGLSPSAASDWEEITLKATCAEGAGVSFKSWFYCYEPKAELEAIPGNISLNAATGKSKTVDILLRNNGAGPTGTLSVMLPNIQWMSLAGTRTLPSIASGDTVQFTLNLAPGAKLQTGPYSGSIVVNCENGKSVSIPFDIKVVSENTGRLSVDVTDEYSYNTASKPHLANAKVMVADPYSGATVVEGLTGQDGLFVTDPLPEGQYILTVTADKHDSYRSTVIVEASENNYQEVFVSFNAISYEWLVIPTEIEDKYDIELITKFETNVPKPVLVIEVPDMVPELVDCEPYSFMVKVTNKGLIAAKDVTLNLPEDPQYRFTCAIGKFDLPANQTVEVPVVMECNQSQLFSSLSSLSCLPCGALVLAMAWYECGEQPRYLSSSPAFFQYVGKVCEACDIRPSGIIGRIEKLIFDATYDFIFNTLGSISYPCWGCTSSGIPGYWFIAPTRNLYINGCFPNMRKANNFSVKSDYGDNAVCASVTLQIDQKLVMTREAFRGTLSLFNGHESEAMKDVNLQLTVKDTDGNDCSDLFQIVSPENAGSLKELTAVDGTGTLAANTTGVVTILFIPEKGAAPETAKTYRFGGKLSYFDPFNSEATTVNLLPVELEVHPSPDLHIHYFMQRDVFGDDPLTDEIEPVIPAELAVLIDNQGYGEAKKVMIESAQPAIIENEKGLLIDFKLISSNFNGQVQQMGLTNINFGNIAPRSQALGQWWLTSTLMGHFTSFETRISHLNSYGNPDLSLIGELKMHELIRSVKGYSVPYSGVIGFLVNDIPDAKDTPDAIWFADGTHTMVQPAVNATVDGILNNNNKSVNLTVEVSSSGWSYTKTDDPGKGKYRLVSVTREDGQVIPLTNVWQTHCTMPDQKIPVYENKLHVVDTFAMASLVKYTLVYEEVPQSELHILSINGIPSGSVTQPLDKVEVVFNKPVKAGSFDWQDLDLYLPGSDNLVTSAVTVIQEDDVTWEIDLSEVTLQSGQYTLTVNTEGISDTDGQPGQRPAQVSWVQILSQNVITIQQSICEGEVYVFHGQTLDKPGSYYHVEYETVVENITRLDLTVHPLPTVSLGDDLTVQGLSVELDAGEGYASYLWSTGESGRKITITGMNGESVSISVTVTNGHGCQATDDVTLTLQARMFTVTFDTQGGNSIDAIQVQEGEKVGNPVDPVKDGCTFDGWYREATCKNAWNFDTDIVNSDITLYAKWEREIVDNVDFEEALKALVYPNPVQSGKDLYIRLESGINNSSLIEIYDVAGKLISKSMESDHPIHLKVPVEQGIYYLRITNGNRTVTYKLIVE